MKTFLSEWFKFESYNYLYYYLGLPCRFVRAIVFDTLVKFQKIHFSFKNITITVGYKVINGVLPCQNCYMSTNHSLRKVNVNLSSAYSILNSENRRNNTWLLNCWIRCYYLNNIIQHIYSSSLNNINNKYNFSLSIYFLHLSACYIRISLNCQL